MFEPRQVEMTTLWDEGKEEVVITRKPLVTLWCHRLIHSCAPQFTPEALGYRRVSYRIDFDNSLYARPWLLWAVLRLRQKMREVYWASLDWLYHRGIIHWRTPECLPSRWRDLGLGPTPKDR